MYEVFHTFAPIKIETRLIMAISNDFNEQERGRRESLAKLRELGINP